MTLNLKTKELFIKLVIRIIFYKSSYPRHPPNNTVKKRGGEKGRESMTQRYCLFRQDGKRGRTAKFSQ